jgi:hypothetical protein
MTESAMLFIESPQANDRVVAVKIDGELTTEDMKTLIDRFQSIVDRNEKVLFYLDMQGYEGSEFGVVTEKFKHIGMLWKACDRYAIVGDTHWMERLVKIVDPLTPQQIRHFTPDKVDDAWAWLLAAEASVVA